MKVNVLINSFNYSKYILECVESALNNTYKNKEIILIDDGSTDNTIELLKKHYGDDNRLKIIQKKNGGQLSVFNEAINYITGEVVFFLDADDLYKENYIEEIVKLYSSHKDIDFVFCAYEMLFFDGKREVKRRYENDKKIGYSLISTLYGREWIGSPTSAISMKTSLLKKILPLPFEEEYITRADDCLIYGASILGAQKYYYSQPLVVYRIHGNNLYYNRTYPRDYEYRTKLKNYRLFNFLKQKTFLDDNILNTIDLEYKLRETADLKVLRIYLKILMLSKISFFKKIEKFIKLVKAYFKILMTRK